MNNDKLITKAAPANILSKRLIYSFPVYSALHTILNNYPLNSISFSNFSIKFFIKFTLRRYSNFRFCRQVENEIFIDTKRSFVWCCSSRAFDKLLYRGDLNCSDSRTAETLRGRSTPCFVLSYTKPSCAVYRIKRNVSTRLDDIIRFLVIILPLANRYLVELPGQLTNRYCRYR